MKKENKLNLTKRILIIISLLVIIIMLGVANTISYAAIYSSKFTSVEIPNKYEKYYENTDDESEWVSYQHYVGGGKSVSVHYNVFERFISGLTIYTQTYLNDYVSNLETYAKDFGYNLTILHKQLIENNGCKGMRIAYKLHDTEYNTSRFYDEYYFLTDNYEVELSFTSTDSTFINSQEEQAIVKSFKIKDTVLISRDIPFTDVASNAWYYKAVKYSYENNMIKGINDYTFAPNQNLTRGMLVTILWRMEGNPKATSNQFKDVSSKEYYYDAVNWAASKRIVNGYDNGKFGPNDLITREQLAVMLRNYANYKKKDVSARTDLSKFKDNTKISGYAKDAVSWAVAKKIISGKSGGTIIDPYGKATRAEAASMLFSYCMNVK